MFKGRTLFYEGPRGIRMKKTLKTGRINWRFREVSSSLLLFRSAPNDTSAFPYFFPYLNLYLNLYLNPYLNPHLNVVYSPGTHSGHCRALAYLIRKICRTAAIIYTVFCRFHFFHLIISLGLPQLLLVLMPFLIL